MRRLGRYQRKAVRYRREAMRRWRRAWRARVGQAAGLVQAGVVQTGRQGPGERAAVGSEAPRVGSGRCWSLMPASAYEANFERRSCSLAS